VPQQAPQNASPSHKEIQAQMTMPLDDATSGGILAQILMKQGEMGVQLAVMNEQLKVLTDHEVRIRALERVRWQMAGIGATIGMFSAFLGWLFRGVHP
jgi:hypothetical protein